MKSNSNSIALEIEDLTKVYSDGNVLAVDNISFSVKKGEIFAFLGPNGAGKSTTISMAATALDITSGKISIFEHDVVKERKEVRKYIGICPQEIVLYERLTVYENAVFFGKMHEIPKEQLKRNADFLIEALGLKEKRNTAAAKLSGGMKRRLNIILALITDPELIFLDEPTAGLDPQSRRLVWDFIHELKKNGKTVFLTTHNMEEADYLSDRVAIIDRGKIIALDTPFDLKRQYTSGDLVEIKFDDSDEIILKNLSILKENPSYKESYYLEDDNLLRVFIQNGLQFIGELISKLNSMGMTIVDMNVKANSLENVFINLTGRNLRD